MNLAEIRERLKQVLGRERYDHTLRVEQTAIKLAQHHHASEEKAQTAALLHDLSKRMSRNEMLEMEKAMGFILGPLEQWEPKILHGPLSAKLAEKEFGVTDPEILQAIARHTTGAPNMSILEKILYLADHTEPARNYPGVEKVRSLAYTHMDQALVVSATSMIQHLLENGEPIYPLTLETRNFYILQTGKPACGRQV